MSMDGFDSGYIQRFNGIQSEVINILLIFLITLWSLY
jgi:hypothetical protein